MTVGSNPFYYHADRLGSVVNLTSGNGTKQWTWDYGPFGTQRSETKHKNNAPANFLKYAGGYLDPTALYHLRARQYDPAVGRFTTVDPAPAPVSDPYVAAYVYVRNNPVRLTDPSGRCSEPTPQPGDRNERGQVWTCYYPLPMMIYPICEWVTPQDNGIHIELDICTFQRGLGVGLIIGGAGLELASASVEIGSGGLATVFAGATAVSGILDIKAGLELVFGECR